MKKTCFSVITCLSLQNTLQGYPLVGIYSANLSNDTLKLVRRELNLLIMNNGKINVSDCIRREYAWALQIDDYPDIDLQGLKEKGY